jgi:hypothetical protein
VRVCSRCGTSYGDDELFCDVDGEALASEAELFSSGETPTRILSVGDGCTACGERLANDGEGYCRACGYRLEAARRDGKVLVEGGVKVGSFEVIAAAGDELRGRDTRLPQGDPARERDLVVGSTMAIDLEAQALEMLAKVGTEDTFGGGGTSSSCRRRRPAPSSSPPCSTSSWTSHCGSSIAPSSWRRRWRRTASSSVRRRKISTRP